MKIPKSLRLGTIQVPIKLHERLELGDLGQFHGAPRPTIHLAKQDSHVAGITIFHELLHCISDQYGVGLSERQVRVLEQTLTGAMRDNPEFFRGLIARR